jgi:hypothetical protein
MNINRNRGLIMTFAADAESAKDYEGFITYFNAYKSNASVVGDISMDEAHKNARDFLVREVEKISGKKASNWESNLMQYCNFTDVREAAFSVISVLTDMIIPDALLKDLAPIAEFHNVAWGDTLKIEVRPRDLFLPSKIGRAQRLGNIRRQFASEFTVPTYLREVTVGITFYDILTGKYTLAEYVMKASMGIEAQVRYDVWDAFGTAVGALDSSGDAKLVYTGYTQDDLVTLAQTITAWNSSKAVIMGTKIACSKVLPATTNYRTDLESSYVKEGSLRDFFGTTIIQMDQIADYTTEFALKLDDTKLYVLSPATQKIMHVGMEGNTLSTIRDAQQSAHLLSTGTLMKSWGVIPASSALAGVMTIS